MNAPGPEIMAIAKIARLVSRDPEVEIERLYAALQGLVDRLDEIHADRTYQSVWAVNQIHAGPYNGPTYVDALARTRAALNEVTRPTKSG